MDFMDRPRRTSHFYDKQLLLIAKRVRHHGKRGWSELEQTAVTLQMKDLLDKRDLAASFEASDEKKGISIFEQKQPFVVKTDKATTVTCWADIEA